MLGLVGQWQGVRLRLRTSGDSGLPPARSYFCIFVLREQRWETHAVSLGYEYASLAITGATYRGSVKGLSQPRMEISLRTVMAFLLLFLKDMHHSLCEASSTTMNEYAAMKHFTFTTEASREGAKDSSLQRSACDVSIVRENKERGKCETF